MLTVEVRHEGKIPLPGYYRRNKEWDIVALHRGVIVGAVEFKSQVGSFGNNANNRTEETIGSAVDAWRSFEAGYLGRVRPWIAYVLVLEDSEKSTHPLTRPPKIIAPYSPDPVFNQTSYLDRYRILLQRLVREGKYDAAVVVATRHGEGISSEPVMELSFANLVAAIRGRLEYISNLPDEAFSHIAPILDVSERTHDADLIEQSGRFFQSIDSAHQLELQAPDESGYDSPSADLP